MTDIKDLLEYAATADIRNDPLVIDLAEALARSEREIAVQVATIEATINYIDNYMWHEMHESTVGVHCSGCEQQQELRDLLAGVATLNA